ncbi:MAG: hypothetical protein PHW04_10065 [Candidatus Wallbacteria bacterium]|nr:hypothetical protein [Candidatus Wallbacteria bacterium]
MNKTILLSLLLLTLSVTAAPLYLPGDAYFINVDAGRVVRYIEVDWRNFDGVAATGTLYLNSVPYSTLQVGAGSNYPNTTVFMPDIKRWDGLNTYIYNSYILIGGSTVEVFNSKIVYLDYVDLYNTTWYYPGWSVYLSLDSSRILRYIEVDWRSGYWWGAANATGTLYWDTSTLVGAKNIGPGTYLFGNLFLPDCAHWGEEDYDYANFPGMHSSGFIYIQNMPVQIFAIRIVYNDTGSFVPYPLPTTAGGSTSWSYHYNQYVEPSPSPYYNYPSYSTSSYSPPVPAYPYPPYHPTAPAPDNTHPPNFSPN